MIAHQQEARYAAALPTFVRVYGPGPVHVFRAPGRVNLIGEHTDYNHGFVLPVALDREVLLLVRPRPDGTVRPRNVEPDFAPRAFAIGPAIPPAPRGDWSNYVRGAAQMVAQQVGPRQVVGMDGLVVPGEIEITGPVPADPTDLKRNPKPVTFNLLFPAACSFSPCPRVSLSQLCPLHPAPCLL